VPPAAGILPQAFIPAPAGTEHSPAQQLAAIFSAFGKQGGKVKFASIKELDEALNDWATDAVKAGESAQHVEAIRRHQRLLIVRFTVSERMPLAQVLEYHRLWCKGVHAGTIDMLAKPHNSFNVNWDILDEVKSPLHFGTQGSSSSPRAQDNGRSNKGDKAKKPTAAKHPAGSCTHHPTSTSHTTAECIKKDK
jgi:hypothetical protein